MEEIKIEEVRPERKPFKSRCRIKKLLNLIQEQLDFYFSDVNLNHDRFLRKEIEQEKDGYVHLSTMLKFNKLKQLTSDTTMLAKAVDNSPSLELSVDRNKIRRKTKLRKLESTDPQTVYVENFPCNIDHDWLKLVFSTCGTVEYISLPKYKQNNQVKGFAFIEYSTPQEADKACQILNTISSWKNKSKRRSTSESRNLERNNEDSSPRKKANRRRRSSSESDCGNKHVNMKRKRNTSECSGDSPLKNVKPSTDKQKVCNNNKSDLDKLLKTDGADEIKISANSVEFLTPKKQRHRNRVISSGSSNELKKICSDEDMKNNPQNEVIRRKRKFSNVETETNTKIKVTNKCTEDSTEKDSISSVPMHRPKSVINNDNVDEKNVEFRKESSEKDCSGRQTKIEYAAMKDEKSKRRIDISEESMCEKKTLLDDSHDNSLEEVVKDEIIENVDQNLDESRQENVELKNGKKKNRQHKKKGKDLSEVSVPPLHVIPKSEWLLLKKEYKRLQRLDMAELKRNLKVLKIEQVRRMELKERIAETLAAKGMSEQKWDSAIGNEELVGEGKVDDERESYKDAGSNKESVDTDVDLKSKGVSFTPGTVVALKTSSEKLTKKNIRDMLSPTVQVAYVDFVDGLYQGFVRFSTSGDVEKILSLDSSEKQCWGFELRKLSVDEEKEYFHRAEADRIKKYDKQIRKKQKKVRGADKISRDVENVSNRIQFD